MSRSQYVDEGDFDSHWDLIRWRGAVKSAIRGKRGQAFLRELAEAMDAMPKKALIAGDLVKEGEACALGCVALKRGMDVSAIDPEEFADVACAFGISEALAREIEYENDEVGSWKETDEQRFERVRRWVDKHIAAERKGAV